MAAPDNIADLLRDPVVAAHAMAEQPVWLFSTDGNALVFANPAACAMLGLGSPAAAAGAPVTLQALCAQLKRIGQRLTPGGRPQLGRLRGLGMPMGGALTCTCAKRVVNGRLALLVQSIETVTAVEMLPMRAGALLKDVNAPLVAFDADGRLLARAPGADGMIPDGVVPDMREVSAETWIAGTGSDQITLAMLHPAIPALTQPEAEPVPAAASRDDGQEATHAATPPVPQRPYPLRFVFETDADNRLTMLSEDFLAQTGPRTRKLIGRFWGEISAKLAFDPQGFSSRALRSRDTWSGIVVEWPLVSGERVPVELSGIPAFDKAGHFRGYRGLGVARTLTAATASLPLPKAETAEAATTEPASDPAIPDETAAPATPAMTGSAPEVETGTAEDVMSCAVPDMPADPSAADEPDPSPSVADAAPPEEPEARHEIAPDATAPDASAPDPSAQDRTAQDVSAEDATEAPASGQAAPTENIVQFPASDMDTKFLTATESIAFHELGSRLAARLRGADELARGIVTPASDDERALDALIATHNVAALVRNPSAPRLVPDDPDLALDRPILDRLPFGIMIYKHGNLLYANDAFLRVFGHRSLDEFAESGGLDALMVDDAEPAPSSAAGRPLHIARPGGGDPIPAQIFDAPIDGDLANMLVLAEGLMPASPSFDDRADALTAVLDIATDGVVIVDAEGLILEVNAGAERLFGYTAGDLAGRAFTSLFAADSEAIAASCLARALREPDGRAEAGREITGRRRQGNLTPLLMSIGRIDPAGERYCATFRDIAQIKYIERELIAARRQADRDSAAQAGLLARISHEIRTPLNAIIGFSDVMIEERFGPVGNERYRVYLRDIHASGSHLLSLFNGLLDLTKIEAGRMELNPAPMNLNDLVQEIVTGMQEDANAAPIIMRSALSHDIADIVADARCVRDMIVNLLSNAIRFTRPGGQVIVSTAAGERSEIVLRIRDTGIGMSAQDIEAALHPFRQKATALRDGTGGTGLGLPLTKALAEANRARFTIKSTPGSGTLAEIAFASAPIRAESRVPVPAASG